MKKSLLISASMSVMASASSIAESMPKDGRNGNEIQLENTVEGIVEKIDVTPMHVDDAGEVQILRDDGTSLIIYINACQGACSKAANKMLFKLKTGCLIEAKGFPVNGGNISIYDDAKHFIRFVPDEAIKTPGKCIFTDDV